MRYIVGFLVFQFHSETLLTSDDTKGIWSPDINDLSTWLMCQQNIWKLVLLTYNNWIRMKKVEVEAEVMEVKNQNGGHKPSISNFLWDLLKLEAACTISAWSDEKNRHKFIQYWKIVNKMYYSPHPCRLRWEESIPGLKQQHCIFHCFRFPESKTHLCPWFFNLLNMLQKISCVHFVPLNTEIMWRLRNSCFCLHVIFL